MKQALKHFLNLYRRDKKHLLLALSGGPDSLALFYLLLETKGDHGLEISVAHVDHGWRPGSAGEAAQLKQLCEKKRIPFYLKTLEEVPDSNKEAVAREARYAFFKSLMQTEGFCALLTAHHADDQAETVLKRVLEGASLPALKGLAPCSTLYGMTVWRPLLSCRKKDILDYLNERGITPFFDETNQNPQFLRSRLRHQLLPTLSQIFGKQVVSALSKIGRQAAELQEFICELVRPYRSEVMRLRLGVSIDFSNRCPSTLFEWKSVLRVFMSEENLSCSTALLEQIISHLIKKNTKVVLRCQNRQLYLDKGVLFVLNEGVKIDAPLDLKSLNFSIDSLESKS